MSQVYWNLILENYRIAYQTQGDEFHMSVGIVVALLMEERDLSMLNPINENDVLTMYIGNFYDGDRTPTITLELKSENGKPSVFNNHIKFTFRDNFKDGKVYRQIKETVFCSFSEALEVFDELFEKLKAATPSIISIG